MLEFLQSGEGAGTGGSDAILGIVQQMAETLEADIKESTEQEAAAKDSFASLIASKEAEIAAAGTAVEGKTAKSGELAVSLVEAKNALADTKDAMADDEKMKESLATGCATKEKEWDARCKARAEEVQAISEAIEMLNGDDALELFKKTLPSFLQVSAGASLRAKIRMHARASDSEPKKFLMLQVGTANMGETVSKIIGQLIETNNQKQADDDKQKAFCEKELEVSKAEEKALTENVATLTTEIEALQQGLADLDKSVAEATEQRKQEHAEFLSTAQANQAAVELIGMAKNRMAKFYSPSTYKAPPTTTVADSPYGLLQQPEGPPSGEVKKNAGGTGVMAMMDQIIKDVEMEMQEAKHEEESAQKDYEEAMKDAAEKRPADSKIIVEKTDAKATAETNLQTTRTSLASTRQQLREAGKKVNYLHGMCDQFLADYEEKTKSRAAENDLLKEQQQVVAQAAPVFLQP